MRRALLMLMLVVVPSTTYAEGQQWGISIWGLSYHVNRSADYNEDNWGLGVRRSARPRWWWLGKDEDNRVFVEVDALRNSNRGLVLPLSAGAEYEVVGHSHACKLFAVGALTLAYYQYPQRNTTDLKFGPVPGLAIGCGHVKVSALAVLRKSGEPLAALSAFVTVGF